MDVPEPAPHEVLIASMAAGINYNNVWAARGIPIDVIAVRQKIGEPYDFHVGGSDAAGIVYSLRRYGLPERTVNDPVREAFLGALETQGLPPGTW